MITINSADEVVYRGSVVLGRLERHAPRHWVMVLSPTVSFIDAQVMEQMCDVVLPELQRRVP